MADPVREPRFAPAGFFALRTPLLPFDELVAWSDGILFVNPGSATLPARPRPSGLGTMAILDLRERTAMVNLVNV